MTKKTNHVKRMRAVPMHIPITFSGSTETNVRPSDFVLPGSRFRARTLIYGANISTEGVFAQANEEQEDGNRNS